MYKIIKLLDKRHFIINERDNIVYSPKDGVSYSLRQLILYLIDNKLTPGYYNKIFFYETIETIETLESLDLDYIKNKFIHYLI